jgi:hypothetical protein
MGVTRGEKLQTLFTRRWAHELPILGLSLPEVLESEGHSSLGMTMELEIKMKKNNARQNGEEVAVTRAASGAARETGDHAEC